MSQQKHLIKTQILEVRFQKKETAEEVREKLASIYRAKLLPMIEQMCNQYSEPGIRYRIEKLELDLGRVQYDMLEQDLVKQLEEQLGQIFPKTLQKALAEGKGPGGPGAVMPALEIIPFFLETGTLPWWVDQPGPDCLPQALEKALKSSPAYLKTLLRKVLDSQGKQKRLIRSFSDADLMKIGVLLFPHALNPSKQILSHLLIASKDLPALQKLSQQNRRILIWQAVFFSLLQNRGIPQSPRSFLMEICLQLASSLKMKFPEFIQELKQSSLKSGKKDSTAIPNWGDILDENQIDPGRGPKPEGQGPFLEKLRIILLNKGISQTDQKRILDFLRNYTPADLSPDLLENISLLLKKLQEGTHWVALEKETSRDWEGNRKELAAQFDAELSMLNQVETIVPNLMTRLELAKRANPDGNLKAAPLLKKLQKQLEENKQSLREMESLITWLKKFQGNHPGMLRSTAFLQQIEKLITALKVRSSFREKWEKGLKKILRDLQREWQIHGATFVNREAYSGEISELIRNANAILDRSFPSPTSLSGISEVLKRLKGREPSSREKAFIKELEAFIEAQKAIPKKSKTEKIEENAPSPPITDLHFSNTDRLLVHNAGLVLLWPFFSTLFANLDLLEDKLFKDTTAQNRGALLLQYLASGSTSSPEFLLPLNKALCGISLEMPIETELILRPEEAAECQNLLETVLDYWKGLGKISVEGFRQSFLKREGILSSKNGSYRLQIEKQTHDVLIDRIPWGFRMVKLPWMEVIMVVEW